MGYFAKFFARLSSEELLNFQPSWVPPTRSTEAELMKYADPDTKVDGTKKGFVYKPASEDSGGGKGSLVILIPNDYGDCTVQLQCHGVTLETGTPKGETLGHDPHGAWIYRFSKPGVEYPFDLNVVLLRGGRVVKTYSIPNPGLRYD